MEEDVATNSSYIPGDSNLVHKAEENGIMKSEEKPSDSFAPSQYQTLSRILSINPLSDTKGSSSNITTNSVQKTEEMDDAAISCCVCGEPSTKRISEDDTQILQIECDICRVWYHAHCVGIGAIGILAIDKYHCPRCSPMCGPSILKPRTNTHRHDYTDPNSVDLVKQVGTIDFVEELRNRIMPDVGLSSANGNIITNGNDRGNDFDNSDVVTCLPDGRQLTLPFLNSSGFCRPILVDVCDPEGLGLVIPDAEFTSDDVPSVVDGGRERIIDIIDVHSQDTRRMSLGEFCDSFRITADERDSTQCLNCLSLEVSDSSLGIHHLTPPRVARQLCWVNNVWPKAKSKDDNWSTDPPKVQKYCIMSMKNAFTDFHIDFGGTSVWYHIFKGEKIFYFIRPTATNLSLYERWQRLSTQSEIFLGDMVDKCYRCVVREGQTLIIPTGWIHAVLTTEDSLVFGGNFLHSLNIQLQLKVFEIEERIRIPRKFRFPSYEAVNWLAAQKLKNDLSDLNGDSTLCPAHLLGGIRSLLQTLRTWILQIPSKSDNESSKNEKYKEREPCPSLISDPHKLVRDLNKEVRFAEKIQLKCNPPKPARESTRTKRKKADDDFIDISSRNALTFFNQPPSKKKKGNAATKSGRGKQKVSEEEPSGNENYVVSKKFPFNKVKSNAKRTRKNQLKQASEDVDILDPSDSNKNIVPTKGKKLREQSKTKSNRATDIQKEKDKEMRKKKSLSSSKQSNGEVDGKEKKTRKTSKKNLSTPTVQNNESHEEDIDIITMHNDTVKGNKKTLKTLSPKKKLLEKNFNVTAKKQPKESKKISAKGKLVKANAKKKGEGQGDKNAHTNSSKEKGKQTANKRTKKADAADKRLMATSDFNKSNAEENITIVSSSKKKSTTTKKVRSKGGAISKQHIPQSENGYSSDIISYSESSENTAIVQKPSAKKRTAKFKQNEKDNRKKSPIKLKLPRVPPLTGDNFNSPPLQNHFMNSPSLESHSAPIMLQDGLPQSLLPQTPLPLSALSSPSPSNYDLTDRDSVRQLLSSRGNPIHSLHRQSVVRHAPMKELNSALGDALAGFDGVQNDQNDTQGQKLVIDVNPSKSRRQDDTLTAAAGPIKLKLKMFGKTSPGDSISSNQSEPNPILKGDSLLPRSIAGSKLMSSIALKKPLSAEQQKQRAAMLFGSAGATAASEKMTKVHQDDDYIYPSLDLSDDEMEIAPTSLQGSNAGRDKGSDGDTAWCPKMRVRNLAVNQRIEPRPSRDNARKVAAVEMGLKMAAEKRRKSSALAVNPNSLILHSSTSSTKSGLKSKGNSLIKKRKTQTLLPMTQTPGPAASTSFAPESEEVHNSPSVDLLQTPVGSSGAAGSVPTSSSSLQKSSCLMKPKKGSLTAKQRLGKILKLKF